MIDLDELENCAMMVESRVKNTTYGKMLNKPTGLGVEGFSHAEKVNVRPLDTPKENVETLDNHYKRGMQPREFMEKSFTEEEYQGFCKGNIIKYVSRFDKKGTPLEDLRKAKEYIDWIIERMEER